MVHISDGILAPEILALGFIITGIILVYSLSRIQIEEIPKLSLVTGAMFIASLIHIPIGPTSVHLIFAGLAGIILGFAAFPAVFIATVLQALLFQHGGITTIGVNSMNIGLPALISASIFWLGVKKTNYKQKYLIFGSMAGSLAMILTLVFSSITLIITGQELVFIIILLIVAHIPVIIIETVLIGNIAEFLFRVKPEMLSWVSGGKVQIRARAVKS
jgi:cobalt/nickel transport system permease protein